MEVVTIDGKDFVKASVAARQAGYTADYVGQLARAGSIPARLIGRTWYVDVETLRTHRVEKKRFAREKAREQVKRAVEEKKALQSTPKASESSRNLKTTTLKYQKDEGALIPTVAKISVSEATTKISNIETPTSPAASHISVPVTIVRDNSVQVQEKVVEERAKPVTAVKKQQRQVIAPRKETKVSPEMPVISKPTPVVTAKKVEPTKVARQEKRIRIMPVLVLLVSVLFSLAIMSFEIYSVYTKTSPTLSTIYVINIWGPVEKYQAFTKDLGLMR